MPRRIAGQGLRFSLRVALAAGFVATMPFAARADDEADPVFGIKMPAGYRDWRLISVAHEEGSLNDLRAILGNDAAIDAYRQGKNEFPDGAIIARLAWDMSHRRKTTRCSAGASPLSPGRPRRAFSSWSRTRRNTPRPGVGGSRSSPTASRLMRPCLERASPVTSPRRRRISSTRATHRKR